MTDVKLSDKNKQLILHGTKEMARAQAELTKEKETDVRYNEKLQRLLVNFTKLGLPNETIKSFFSVWNTGDLSMDDWLSGYSERLKVVQNEVFQLGIDEITEINLKIRALIKKYTGQKNIFVTEAIVNYETALYKWICKFRAMKIENVAIEGFYTQWCVTLGPMDMWEKKFISSGSHVSTMTTNDFIDSSGGDSKERSDVVNGWLTVAMKIQNNYEAIRPLFKDKREAIFEVREDYKDFAENFPIMFQWICKGGIPFDVYQATIGVWFDKGKKFKDANEEEITFHREKTKYENPGMKKTDLFKLMAEQERYIEKRNTKQDERQYVRDLKKKKERKRIEKMLLQKSLERARAGLERLKTLSSGQRRSFKKRMAKNTEAGNFERDD